MPGLKSLCKACCYTKGYWVNQAPKINLRCDGSTYCCKSSSVECMVAFTFFMYSLPA